MSDSATASGGLDDARRTSIAAALARFRSTVSDQNLAMLRILVEGMAAQDDGEFEEEDAEMFRLLAFSGDYFQGDLPGNVHVVQDLLLRDVLPELIANFSLDGVDDTPVDLEARHRWFADIQAGIAARHIEAQHFPPADLEYLSSLVSAVTGPGLPYNRVAEQFAFISLWTDDESRAETRNRAGIDMDLLWEDWDIIVACRLGDGPRSWGGSFALFCSEKHGGMAQKKWRYGVHDEEWCSDLYDSVEDFLDFYAHFREQTEASTKMDIRDLEAMG